MRKNFIFMIVGIIVLTLIVWTVKIINDELPYIDQWTRAFVPGLKETKLFYFLRGVTELGSRSFLLPFTIVCSILLWIIFQDWLPALFLSGGTLATHLLNKLIKGLVARERPSIWVEANAEGYSFPSGHAMIPIVCYGMLVYFLSKKIKSNKIKVVIQGFFGLLIFLIGFSRYVINVHYLTDILAGFSIGFGCLLLLIGLDIFINKHRTQPKD